LLARLRRLLTTAIKAFIPNSSYISVANVFGQWHSIGADELRLGGQFRGRGTESQFLWQACDRLRNLDAKVCALNRQEQGRERQVYSALIPALFVFVLASCGTADQGASEAPGLGDAPADPPPIGDEPPPGTIAYEPIVIEGEDIGANLGDPSLEYEPTGLRGWLAYTDVEGNDFPIGPFHHTNIAVSDDAGESWTLAGRVFTSLKDTLITPDGEEIEGVWAYEVPTLVHAPGDVEAPWKLFAHRYFLAQGERRVEFGWITVSTARSPLGPWREEEPLLGTGFTPFAPLETRVNVSALDPSLADLVALSEPGSLYRDGVLYLSLTGLMPDGPEQIFLIASDDYGESWRFVSTLLTKSDARAFGAERYDASSLVQVKGRVFLLASPQRGGLIHDGTSIFEFEDMSSGTLRRKDTAPMELAHIPVQTDPIRGDDRGGGQADYDQHNTAGGVVFHQVDADNRPGAIIQIFNTKRTLSGL